MDDLVGTKYNRWLVVGLEGKRESNCYEYYNCLCECGTEKSVRIDTLKKGISKSCGCLQKELQSEKMKTHGYSKHECWQAYYDMYRRCYDENRKDFHHYGGKGIQVDHSWLEMEQWNSAKGFLKFLEDMGPKPFEKAEIERFDNSKNYCKENCYWEQRRAQNNNKSINRIIVYKGYELSLSQWAHLLGMRSQVICDRINKLKWDEIEALSTAPKIRGKSPRGDSDYKGLEHVIEFLETGQGRDDLFSKSIFKRVMLQKGIVV